MKLSKEDLKEIKKLRKKGMSYPKLAKLFNVSHVTIAYHLNEETKKKIIKGAKKSFKNQSPEQKANLKKKQLEWSKKWQSEHREQDNAYKRKWRHKNKDKVKESNRRYRQKHGK